MQFIAHQRAESGGVLSPAEKIWFEYYLGNNHLLRIAVYMMIAYLGFVVSLPSKLRYLDDKYIEENFSGNRNINYIKTKWLYFEVISKLVVASAIIFNESTMAYWRLHREIDLYALKDGKFSTYFGWSIIDAFR
jgi:hypothetical protein